jgi:hypothetical protein
MPIDLINLMKLPIEEPPDGPLVWVEVSVGDAERWDDWLDAESFGGGFKRDEDNPKLSEAEWLRELVQAVGIEDTLGEEVLNKIKPQKDKCFRVYGKLHADSRYDSWNGDWDCDEWFEVHKVEECK